MAEEIKNNKEKGGKPLAVRVAFQVGKLAGKINKLGDAARIASNTTSNAIKKNKAIQSTLLSLKKQITTGKAEVFEEIKEVNRRADSIIELLKSEHVNPQTIAIDGVPGSGKSTLARALVKKMNFKWKTLDYIDMDRPLKFKSKNTIYEHHRLFRTQNIDFFDALIYLDESIDHAKKRCLHRKRGAINIEFFDYQKLKKVGQKAFEHAGGQMHVIEKSNIKIKIRPHDGYKQIESIRRELKRKGYKTEARTKEGLFYRAVYGKGRTGLKSYLKLGALSRDLKKGIAAGTAHFFSTEEHKK